MDLRHARAARHAAWLSMLLCAASGALGQGARSAAPPAHAAQPPQAAAAAQTARVRQAFDRALALHRAGKLNEAAAGYLEYIRLVGVFRMSALAAVPARLNLAQIYRGLGKRDEEVNQLNETIRVAPHDPRPLAELAATDVDLKRYSEARSFALRALAEHPAAVYAAPAHFALGTAAAQSHDYATAEREFAASVKLAPDNPQTTINYARVLDYQRKYVPALAVISRACANHPEMTALQMFRAYLATRTRQFGVALAAYDQVLRREPKNTVALFGKAGALQQSGRIQDAITAYIEALAVQPNNLVGRTNLGDLYYRFGNYSAAKIHFAAAIELSPKDPRMLDRLALCELEDASRLMDPAQKRAGIARAEIHFKRAEALSPQDPLTQDALAFFYARTARFEDSVREYRKELAGRPGSLEIYASLARVYEMQKDARGALGVWAEYRQVRPDDIYGYAEAAHIDEAMGQFADAIQQWKAYLQKHPRDGQALVSLGSDETGLKRYAEARAAYTGVLDPSVTGAAVTDPGGKGPAAAARELRLQAVNGLAVVARAEGKQDEELDYLQQAVHLERNSAASGAPVHGDAYQMLAQSYEQHTMNAKAVQTYNEWAVAFPHDPTPLTLLARLEDRTSDPNDAVRDFERAAARSRDPVPLRMEAAEVYHHNRQLEQSARLYEQIKASAPHDTRVYSALAQVYDQMERYDRGLDNWRALANSDPNASWASDRIATDLVRLKRYPEAIAQYNLELDKHPQNIQTYADLQKAYELNGHAGDYLAALTNRLKTDPGQLSLMEAVVNEYTRQGKEAEGWAYLQQAADASPDPGTADNSLALLYLKKGKTAEGLSEYRRVAARKPDDPAVQNSLAQQLYANGQLQEAVATLVAALKRPGVPVATQVSMRQELMNWYLQAKNTSDAIAQARELVRLEPDNVGASVALANVLAANGGETGAISLYLSLGRNPAHAAPLRSELLLRAGEIYSRENRRAEAIGVYQEALKIDPANTRAAAELKKLQGSTAN